MSQPEERSKQYRVRIEKDYTVFCAGHFITYDGHECEPLHGHNYRAAAALEGPLDENAYVFDFTRLKRALRTVVDPSSSSRRRVRSASLRPWPP